MKTGKYNKNIGFASVCTLLLFCACNNTGEKTETTTNKQDTVTQKHEQPSLELTEQQMKAVGIELGMVEQKNLNSVVKASGQLAVPPQNRADVNVLMGGIIKKIDVLEGQAVSKGQVLVYLENPEFIKIQQEYLSLKNGFSFTEQELQRQQDLNSANAGTGKNLQQAQANYNTDKSKILALEKQLQQLGIEPAAVLKGVITSQIAVTAPIGGTIGHIAVNTGTYAEPAKPLMEIIDNSKIHCDLVVYEKDLFKVKAGQQVHFMLTNQGNRQIQGKIYGINKSFEDESKGIIVHAVIENGETYGLIQGMYVTALIDVGNQLTPAVPVDALVRSEGRDYIFAVDETERETVKDKEQKKDTEQTLHFKKVEVVTGVSELGYTQVTFLEDLPKETKIVAKGAFYILSKMQSGGEEE